MPPRYVVRRALGETRYTVWDAAENAAHSTNLDFADALDLADRLNAGNAAIPAPPSEPQPAVQQQQQPQTKDEGDKE